MQQPPLGIATSRLNTSHEGDVASTQPRLRHSLSVDTFPPDNITATTGRADRLAHTPTPRRRLIIVTATYAGAARIPHLAHCALLLRLHALSGGPVRWVVVEDAHNRSGAVVAFLDNQRQQGLHDILHLAWGPTSHEGESVARQKVPLQAPRRMHTAYMYRFNTPQTVVLPIWNMED